MSQQQQQQQHNFTSELVLASGVAYFNEDFNALPHVVNALTTRSSTMDALKSDASAVDRTLAKMLDRGSNALLTSTSLLSSVSSEFETSKAKVRDLRRRVGASMASLSGRRRDLNGLSFRQTQLEHALGLLENIEICLRACHGPVSSSLALGKDADDIKKAQNIFDNQVKEKVAEDLATKLNSRLQERRVNIAKLLKGRVLDSVSGQGELDEDITSKLMHLRDLGALDETLTDAARIDLRKQAPIRQQVTPYSGNIPSIKCDFLCFPQIDSIEQIIGFVHALIEWGDLLLQRSLHFTASVKALQLPSSHLADTWEFVQDRIERELRPLLDAFASSMPRGSSLSTLSASTITNTGKSQRPRHYVRKKRNQSQDMENSDLPTSQPIASPSTPPYLVESAKFECSPYHITFIAPFLIEFCRRHDPLLAIKANDNNDNKRSCRLMRFLKSTCETSLRSAINRDAASLFSLTLESKSSEFVRSATRLECVVKELRERVLMNGVDDMSESRTLLLDISHPFLHASRQRIDNAVDSLAAAWIARGGARLVNHIRTDPLFLAIEARRNGNPPPARNMLIEASFDHLRTDNPTPISLSTDAGSGKEPLQRVSSSQLSLLTALHASLHRTAKAILSKDEKNEFVSVADYALFAARADVLLRVEFFLDKYVARQMRIDELVQGICSSIRLARLLMECWVENSSVLDFLFLPAIYRLCQFLSRVILSKKDAELGTDHLFALRNAFAAALVDASEDPFGDLTLFDVLVYALDASQCKTDRITNHYLVEEKEAKQLIKMRIINSSCWHYLFSATEISEM